MKTYFANCLATTPDFVLTGFWIYITIISAGLYYEITRSGGAQTLEGFGIGPGLRGMRLWELSKDIGPALRTDIFHSGTHHDQCGI